MQRPARLPLAFSWSIRLLLLLLTLADVSQPTLMALPNAVQRQDYQVALSIHPDDPVLWNRWIAAAIAAHQTEKALALLQYAAGRTGWTPTQRRQVADLFAAQGDVEAAAAYRRSVRVDFPNDADLLRQVIAADLTMRAWPDAIKLLKRLVSLTPVDNEALYELAILIAADQPDMSLKDLGQAAVDSAFHDRAVAASRALSSGTQENRTLKLAVQLVSDEQWSLAGYLLNKALALDGGNAETLALLGVAQEQQGRDGWPLIQQAAKLAPNDPVVSYAAALHWQQIGNPDAALATLTQAEARDPNNPALAAQIGLSYRQRGTADVAAHWLTIAVQLAPGDAGFAALLAAFYADEPYALDSGGLTFIQEAVRHFPQNADLHASLGAALLATGQPAAALPELRQATSIDPGSIRAQYYLAAALEQSGDIVDAQSSYWAAYRAPITPDETTFHDLAGRALQRLGQITPNAG
ncbi:MAG: tetratricopeptide repeat protein [Aggregatilineales bacterium]